MWMPVAVVASPLAVAAATDISSGFDPWQLVGYGLTPVMFVVLILTGQIVSKREHERVVSELGGAREELKAERDEAAKVQASIIDRVIPAVTRQTLVLETIAPLLQTETRVRRDG